MDHLLGSGWDMNCLERILAATCRRGKPGASPVSVDARIRPRQHCAMPSTSGAYRAARPARRASLAPGSDRSAKAARRASGPRRCRGSARPPGLERRDRGRPLVWFHASSVGEGLQAESVLLELRPLLPSAQYVYTHFSPSAEALARRLPVDAADYLPYDLPGNHRRRCSPSSSRISWCSPSSISGPSWPPGPTPPGRPWRWWPQRSRPGSGRLRWPARALARAGYESVASAGAIADEDAARLARLGVPRERIRVLGDPRFDSVAAKVRAVRPEDPLLALGGPRHSGSGVDLAAGRVACSSGHSPACGRMFPARD